MILRNKNRRQGISLRIDGGVFCCEAGGYIEVPEALGRQLLAHPKCGLETFAEVPASATPKPPKPDKGKAKDKPAEKDDDPADDTPPDPETDI